MFFVARQVPSISCRAYLLFGYIKTMCYLCGVIITDDMVTDNDYQIIKTLSHKESTDNKEWLVSLKEHSLFVSHDHIQGFCKHLSKENFTEKSIIFCDECNRQVHQTEYYIDSARVIICGSRDFNHKLTLYANCIYVLSMIKNVEVVSGGARGADKLGESFAKDANFKIKIFRAEWDKFGKSAGYKRNEEMAKYADACIAFWDGESKGTKHMIDLAKKYKLRLRVIHTKR